MKAFIFDPTWKDLVSPEQTARLVSAGIEVIIIDSVGPLQECHALYEGEEDRVLCLNPDSFSWKVTSEDYKDVPHLRAIILESTSTHWLDSTVADERDIAICNAKGFSTNAVSEWAITMMFNLARQTPRLIKDDFPLDFDKDFFTYRGVEIQGKTAGIIGWGNIGQAIAERCLGLGMNVIYWSRNSRSESHDVTFHELDTVLSDADVIFPTMSLTEESKAILTDKRLRFMKSSAILVSVVHELFNQETPLTMINEGKLFGFGFEAKPSTFNDYKGNVWAAPEYAWVTDGSMKQMVSLCIENMVSAAHEEYPNRTN